jgi:hypothetical protein
VNTPLRWKTVVVPLPEPLVAAIDACAQQDERSRPQQIRYLLKEALAQRGVNLAGAEQ